MNSTRILIVEDEAIIAADIQGRIQSFGHVSAGICSTGRGAFDQATRVRPDLVLMDIILKGEIDGIQTARWIRDILDIPVVYLTSHADQTTVQLACGTEPFGYILKPIEDRELRIAIDVAISRHRSETKLRQMERWMTTTLNSIGDGVIAVSPSGHITLFNPHAEKLTGWTRDEAIGRSLDDVLSLSHAESGQSIPSPATQAIRHGIVVHIDRETVLRRRDGSLIPIDDSAAPIRGEDRQIHGAVVVFRDATDRIRHEQEIRGLNQSLERQVESRTEELRLAIRDLEQFTGAVSHDLKAPVRAVLGFSTLLAERLQPFEDEESKLLAGRIVDSASRMGTMIDAFQRLARIQRCPLQDQKVDMHALVEECLAELAAEFPPHPQRSIQIHNLLATLGDRDLLKQCWMNLLSNALKYSSTQTSPSISIGSHAEPDSIRYCIEDNGVGLDLNQADLLFQPFQRFHAATEFHGHGLGLTTVKQIVQRHGGAIGVDSSPGQGARFWFSLPTQSNSNSKPSPAIPPPPSALLNDSIPATAHSNVSSHPFLPQSATSNPSFTPPGPILIVEDEAIIAADLSQRIERLGYTVAGTVSSGEKALDFIRRQPPALVLLDIYLNTPMDGIETALRIGQEHDIPVIYVTSHSDPTTFQRAKSANTLGYVLKPFQDRELVMAIELALNRAVAERRVAESKRWLDATLRSICDALFATDPLGRILFINPAAERLIGRSQQDVFQRDLAQIILVVEPTSGRKVASQVALQLLQGWDGVMLRESILATGPTPISIQECGTLIRNEQGKVLGGLLIVRNVSDLKKSELERTQVIRELQHALDHVRELRSLLPVCAWCRKVRDDDGYWKLFEEYLHDHSSTDVTHSICPACIQKMGKDQV